MIKKFKDDWENKGVIVNLTKIHNWASDSKVKTPPCLTPYSYSTILVNGDVTPCCLDFEGKTILGNINKESLKNIWYSKRYNNFRQDALRLDKKSQLCKNCDLTLGLTAPYFSIIKFAMNKHE